MDGLRSTMKVRLVLIRFCYFLLWELRAQELFPESARGSVLGAWLLRPRASIQNSEKSPANSPIAVRIGRFDFKDR